jgi:hypothetical protein
MELRSWNRNVFGRVKKHIQGLEEKLTALEFQLQADYLDETDAEFKATKMELDVWEKKEETRLAQAAKKKWLKEGDQNSRFFHVVVSQRRHGAVISRMQLEAGTVLESPK